MPLAEQGYQQEFLDIILADYYLGYFINDIFQCFLSFLFLFFAV